MTLRTDLAPTFATELTSQPWMRQVITQLDDPGGPGAGLVGVDIGHVDTPGLVMSEVHFGFVMGEGGIHATGTQFQHVEAEKFCRIRDLVTASIVPSWMTHWAPCDTSPQINTLVFRHFTLAYAFDALRPAAARAASLQARLILHDADALRKPRDLSRSIQACLDGFTAAHDDMRGVRLGAPDPVALERLRARTPA